MKIIEHTRKFEIVDDNSTILGEITYSPSSDKLWIVDHTYVNEASRNQGIGNILLDHLVDVARERAIKIIPLCPFAKKQMLMDLPKYNDVLYDKFPK